jgi:hypothetical protein
MDKPLKLPLLGPTADNPVVLTLCINEDNDPVAILPGIAGLRDHEPGAFQTSEFTSILLTQAEVDEIERVAPATKPVLEQANKAVVDALRATTETHNGAYLNRNSALRLLRLIDAKYTSTPPEPTL